MKTIVKWAAVCWIAGVVWAAACVTGCRDASAPDDAMLKEAASHEAELAVCIAKGKTAHSMPVYMACADDVDERYGIAITDAGSDR